MQQELLFYGIGFPADRKLSQINVDFSSLCNSFELEPEQKAQ